MIALEHLGDNSASDRNFRALRKSVPDTGGQSLIIRGGSVAEDGTIKSGSGFTVTKNGTGDYSVEFAAPFALTPAVIVGTGETAAFYAAKLHASTPPSENGFRVATFITSTTAAVDGIFHWWAVG